MRNIHYTVLSIFHRVGRNGTMLKYNVSWHLLGHAIKSVICFDLPFSRISRPMTSFCIFITYINTGGNGWFYRENTYKCSPLVTKWQIKKGSKQIWVSVFLLSIFFFCGTLHMWARILVDEEHNYKEKLFTFQTWKK